MMDTKHDDRRRSPRVMVSIEVAFSNESKYVYASTADISSTGMFIITQEPEEMGTHLSLRFKLPDDDDVFELDGQVRWFRHEVTGADGKRLSPGMGIEFMQLKQSHKQRLELLLKKLQSLHG